MLRAAYPRGGSLVERLVRGEGLRAVGQAIVRFTDREVLAKANLAKNHAKIGEKDCIAYFDGPLHRPEDLKITRRSSR